MWHRKHVTSRYVPHDLKGMGDIPSTCRKGDEKMKMPCVWTVFYCTSLVVMAILLQGCAGTTHTPASPSVSTVTTQTHTIVKQRVRNPETGGYEMKVVREERTQTQSSMTGNNVSNPPLPPNAHTKHGQSTGETDWVVYTAGLLIIAVNLYLLSK